MQLSCSLRAYVSKLEKKVSLRGDGNIVTRTQCFQRHMKQHKDDEPNKDVRLVGFYD